MRDQTDLLVASHYKDFDMMDRDELVSHLVDVEGREPDIAEDSGENQRECAWTCYAKHLGLEYFQGSLMQFGDDGYPHLYVSPADGGDTLCHECATTKFKDGKTVARVYHMEGEVEYCDDCWREIRPFTVTPPPRRRVVIELVSYNDPAEFDWGELLGLGEEESCKLVSSEEVDRG